MIISSIPISNICRVKAGTVKIICWYEKSLGPSSQDVIPGVVVN
jgi:hypothetical protein